MAIGLIKLKELHDKAYEFSQTTRDNASDDLVFAFINQWDADFLTNSTLGYRGEFDVLIKGIRQVLSDLAENPIQLDFEPVDQERQDAAELLDGIYRTDDNNNLSIESYENAKQEVVACGVGAWEIFTEYSSLRTNNKDQVIRRRPIFESCNTVFWDPNAILLDKSDAKYVSYLKAYSADGYKDLVEELTGEELDSVNVADFKSPNQSYTFPWIEGDSEVIYVTNFYFREKIKTKLITMTNPVGDSFELLEENLKDISDDMMDEGWNIEDEKDITVWQVTKYIASGAEILNGEMGDDEERLGEVIAGEYIPIIPVYGQHAVVEGNEHYEGLTRRAKDPQRLRNFALSYIADIVSRSSRPKPIYWQEQIAGFEAMYSENGIDDNFPYRLMNMKTANGEHLPLSPIGVTPEQPMPQALAALIGLTREAVDDVANAGMPQDVSDPDASGKAIKLLQSRIDMQATIYQQHYKHSKRHDGVVYASMASEIYDVPRKVSLTLKDGTKKESEVMQTVVDKETGKIVVLNDLSNTEFNVTSTAGPSYSSQKEETQEKLGLMIQGMQPGDPKRTILELKMLEGMDGVDVEDLRDYSRKELILLGVRKPDTPEEEQMLKESQEKGTEPSAEMLMGMGEKMKGQAALEKNQIELTKIQLNSNNEEMKRTVDGYKIKIEEQKVQIEAQKVQAEISNKEADTLSKKLDNIAKEKEGIEIPDIIHEDMSDDQLYDILLEA